MDRVRLGEELRFRLGIVGVRHAAVDRAHHRALIEKPDALRALLRDDVRDDVIDVLMQGGMALPVAPQLMHSAVIIVDMAWPGCRSGGP